MRGGSETEIKLVATPDMLQALRSHADLAGPEAVSGMNTAFFDTATGRLAAAGATLRIRESANGREQTLKLTAPGGSVVRRSEWNATVPGDVIDLTLFPLTAQTRLRRLLAGSGIEQVAVARIERTTSRVRFGKSAIELAFDTGTVEAGGEVEAICELELELVEGSVSDVLALASRLPLGPDLHWSLTSKAARALALAFALPERAVHAETLNYAKSCSAADGFRAIAWNCLGHFLGNYRQVVAGAHPEAVHQCRVAIRRFRAACSLFGDIIESDAAPVLRAELKAVATQLGALRDLDVLIVRVAKTAKAAGQDAKELLSKLQDRREAVAGPVQAMLSGAPLQVLLFGLADWIESGAWRADLHDSAGRQPLPEFAARTLTKRRRRLHRKEGQLAALPVEELHALRIDVKKLRYANEFFASLFRGKAIQDDKRRFAKALARLQSSLGDLNDLAVASARTESLFGDLDPITAAGLEVQLAELLNGDRKQVKQLFKAAEKSRSKLGDAPAWWKSGRGDAQ